MRVLFISRINVTHLEWQNLSKNSNFCDFPEYSTQCDPCLNLTNDEILETDLIDIHRSHWSTNPEIFI